MKKGLRLQLDLASVMFQYRWKKRPDEEGIETSGVNSVLVTNIALEEET